MILETGELESAPIVMLKALADDDLTWYVEVTYDPADDGNSRTVEGLLEDVTWGSLTVQVHVDDMPTGETVTLEWDCVEKVLVP